MKNLPTYAVVCAVLLGSIPTVALADTVAIPIGEQTNRNATNIPRSGMKKHTVERNFGNPIQRHAPIGDPPISSWVYNGYTVYFEFDTVIHTVVDHSPQHL